MNPVSRIENPVSRIKNRASRIKNRASRIKNQESRIKNRESRIENQASRIKHQASRIKNRESLTNYFADIIFNKILDASPIFSGIESISSKENSFTILMNLLFSKSQ